MRWRNSLRTFISTSSERDFNGSPSTALKTNNQTKSIVIIKAISSVVPSWVLLLRFSHFSFSLHPPTIQLEIDFPFRGKLLENLLFISRLASSTCATAISTMAEPFTRKFNRIRSDLSTRPKEKLNFRMSTFFLAGKAFFRCGASCQMFKPKITNSTLTRRKSTLLSVSELLHHEWWA